MLDLDRICFYLIEGCAAIDQNVIRKPFIVFPKMDGPTTIISGMGAKAIFAKRWDITYETEITFARSIYLNYDWFAPYQIIEEDGKHLLRGEVGCFADIGLEVKPKKI